MATATEVRTGYIRTSQHGDIPAELARKLARDKVNRLRSQHQNGKS